ncbi:hypothetical protein [uncultured Methanosphaera sp.]|nr:hypothetical protein [uncultured Methanosphaera sp.]
MVKFKETDDSGGCPHGLCLDVCPTDTIKKGSPCNKVFILKGRINF